MGSYVIHFRDWAWFRSSGGGGLHHVDQCARVRKGVCVLTLQATTTEEGFLKCIADFNSGLQGAPHQVQRVEDNTMKILYDFRHTRARDMKAVARLDKSLVQRNWASIEARLESHSLQLEDAEYKELVEELLLRIRDTMRSRGWEVDDQNIVARFHSNAGGTDQWFLIDSEATHVARGLFYSFADVVIQDSMGASHKLTLQNSTFAQELSEPFRMERVVELRANISAQQITPFSIRAIAPPIHMDEMRASVPAAMWEAGGLQDAPRRLQLHDQADSDESFAEAEDMDEDDEGGAGSAGPHTQDSNLQSGQNSESQQ